MQVKFTVTVQKVGNSLQIVIPKPVTDGLGLEQGDKMELILTESGIFIPIPKAKKR